jgi:hypothetical protein
MRWFGLRQTEKTVFVTTMVELSAENFFLTTLKDIDMNVSCNDAGLFHEERNKRCVLSGGKFTIIATNANVFGNALIKSVSTAVAMLTFAFVLAPECDAQSQKTFSQLAEEFAPQMVEKVKGKLPQGVTSRIVVFPPGDSDGKVTPQIAEPSMVLQGELIVIAYGPLH